MQTVDTSSLGGRPPKRAAAPAPSPSRRDEGQPLFAAVFTAASPSEASGGGGAMSDPRAERAAKAPRTASGGGAGREDGAQKSPMVPDQAETAPTGRSAPAEQPTMDATGQEDHSAPDQTMAEGAPPAIAPPVPSPEQPPPPNGTDALADQQTLATTVEEAEGAETAGPPGQGAAQDHQPDVAVALSLPGSADTTGSDPDGAALTAARPQVLAPLSEATQPMAQVVPPKKTDAQGRLNPVPPPDMAPDGQTDGLSADAPVKIAQRGTEGANAAPPGPRAQPEITAAAAMTAKAARKEAEGTADAQTSKDALAGLPRPPQPRPGSAQASSQPNPKPSTPAEGANAAGSGSGAEFVAEAETLAEAQAALPRIRNGSRSAMDGDKPAGTTSPEGIEAPHSAEKAPGTGPGAASEPLRSAAQSRTDTPPAPAALPREAGARLLLDARSADMGRALSERIVSGITRGQGSFDISLRPRNLGAIEVQLSLSQGAVTVKMRTQTEAAARLLTAGEQALAKGVEAAGMRLASVSAEVQPPPQTSTAQAGGQNGPGGSGFAMPQGQANGGGSGGRGTRSPDADAPRKRGPATSAADQTGATDRSYQLAHRKMVINLIA